MEDKGFSYSDPKEQRKRVFRLFGIEMGILLVAVAVILGLLLYLKIIPTDFLSSFFPSPIKVVSDVPEYSIKLQNKDKLLELLNSWGVYGKKYQQPLYGALGSTDLELKEIIIHLTNKPQKANFFNDGKTDYASSTTNISKARFDVYIYVDPKIIDANAKNRPAWATLQTTLWTSIHRIITPSEQIQKEDPTGTKFFEELKSNQLAKVQYFEIRKK